MATTSWKEAGLVVCLLAFQVCSATGDNRRATSADNGDPRIDRYAAGGSYSYSNDTSAQANAYRTDLVTATGTSTLALTSTRVIPGTTYSGAAQPPQESQCDGRGTINAISATLKWWYQTTVSDVVSTVQLLYNTEDAYVGWTVYSARTPFDEATAITTVSCSPPYTTQTYGSSTYTWSECETSPTHVAATTSALFVTGFKTPNMTTGGVKQSIPDLRTTPAPVQVVVASRTFLPGTPFVEFSQYEVSRCVANRNGSHQTRTTRYSLTTPYAFQYTGASPAGASDVDAAITGKLDSAFPSYLNRTTLVPGNWSAPPTVIVIVQEIIVAIAVLAATVAQSAKSLAVPTANLPPGFSSIPPVTTSPQQSNTAMPGPRVEETQSYLLVPGEPTTVAQAQQQAISTTKEEVQEQTASPCATCSTATQPVVIAGATFQPSLTQAWMIGGKTAFRGGSAITVSGQTISAQATANSLVIWQSKSHTFAAPTSGVFTLNGLPFTATYGIMYAGAGATLVPGGQATTISGVELSIAPDGTQIMRLSSSTDGVATHVINGLGGASTTTSDASTPVSTGSSGQTASTPAATSTSSADYPAVLSTAMWLTILAATGLVWVAG